jgi:hypothetical protein
VGPLVGVSPPQIKFNYANPPQGATFVCLPPPYSHCKHLHLVGWIPRAQGWSELPKNRKLPGKPTPNSNFCLLSHTQLFKQIPLFGGVDPVGPLVGVSPPQIKFYQANPPEGAFFVCWHLPYSYCKHLHLVEWTLRAWGEPPKMKFSK